MHPQPTGVAQPAAWQPKKRRLPIVLAAVAGLVIGGGGVGLGWVLTSDDDGGPAGDIATACDIITNLGPVGDIKSDAGFAQQNRLSAATALAVAASTLDPQYQHFTDLLKKAVNAIQETFDAGNATTAQALREATEYCHGR